VLGLSKVGVPLGQEATTFQIERQCSWSLVHEQFRAMYSAISGGTACTVETMKNLKAAGMGEIYIEEEEELVVQVYVYKP
jgi:hypothetical protein